MKHESSLPHSQQPATCPCLQLDQSSPFPPISLLADPLQYYLPFYVYVYRAVSFPLVSPPKPCMHLSSPPLVRATCPASLILLDLIIRIMFGEEYRSRSSSICNFLYYPITSSLLRPNILLNTLFSNTLSLHSSLNVSDHVPYPCKTIGKIIDLYILILVGSVACHGQDDPGIKSRWGQ